MKSFQIRSILLGIGIGTIITAIITMIYMAGVDFGKPKLSDKDIIEKAKLLGMVEPSSIIDESSLTDTKIQTSTEKPIQQKPSPIPTATMTPKPIITPSPLQQEYVTISVVRGDSSERVADKLYEIKLISDKNTFLSELTNLGLTNEINVGDFKIKKGISIKEIIKIITTAK